MDDAIRQRIRDRIVRGPFGRLVGLRLEEVEDDGCRVRLPFRPEIANAVGVVHGGAISALVDTAATGAAWASPRLGPQSRGATASITVTYLEPGLGTDLLAAARVIRRGRALCTVEVDVTDTEARHVARGLVTYRLRAASAGEPPAPSVLGTGPGSGAT